VGRLSSVWKTIKRDRYLTISLLLLLITWALVFVYPAPHDPNRQRLPDRLLSPLESSEYPLGTDQLGRDVLSNLLLGTRASLRIAGIVVVLSFVIGCFLGIIAGYSGGAIEALLMRLVDLQLSMPTFLVALAGAAILGKGVWKLIGILVFTGWVRYARVARGATLSTKELVYVEAARSVGAGNLRIMLRHIFPNVAGPVLVMAFIHTPMVIMTEASLSFLGFGLPANVASIGKMINAGYPYLLRGDWWISLLPGAVLFWIAMAINLFTSAIRDRLDPKLRSAQRR